MNKGTQKVMKTELSDRFVKQSNYSTIWKEPTETGCLSLPESHIAATKRKKYHWKPGI